MRWVLLPVVVAMLAVAAVWAIVRFLRWQFLLRCARVRLPIRPVLVSYLAAMPGMSTPLYFGEVLRAVLLRRRFQAPLHRTVGVLVLERLYDALALALLVALTGDVNARQIAVRVALFAMLLLGMMIAALHRGAPVEPRAETLWSARTIGLAFGSSLFTWMLAATPIMLAGAGVGRSIPFRAGIDVAARTALTGAVAWWPGGSSGAVGHAVMAPLQQAGATIDQAASILVLVQLVSLGVALSLGAVFLVREFETPLGTVVDAPEHFDAIAQEYNAQWSPHVWDLLLDRKLSLMERALGGDSGRAGIGLDLGCGLGVQTAEMRRRGFSVMGIEPSVGLLRQRRPNDLPVVAGDALSLPLADHSLDFVYVIGVLHHLPGRAAQARAFQELARVLKPGGLLLVHESNPRNPLFRFYMGYLFPLLKSIDEGTEWWLHPRTWTEVDNFDLVDVHYFTFLPDFTPQKLMRQALMIERWLERGATRRYSAHYMAVVSRTRLDDARTH